MYVIRLSCFVIGNLEPYMFFDELGNEKWSLWVFWEVG
jgi:hypothetical protein